MCLIPGGDGSVMAPTRVWIFPLPAVFESYVRHRDASPTRQTIRKRGGHGHWRAGAPISNVIRPEDSVFNVEPLGELRSVLTQIENARARTKDCKWR